MRERDGEKETSDCNRGEKEMSYHDKNFFSTTVVTEKEMGGEMLKSSNRR